MNDQHLLRTIGELLYGPQWVNDFARDIRVSDRSMRRWASGSDKIPWGVWFDAFQKLKSQYESITEVKEVLWERVVITAADRDNIENYDASRSWYLEVHDPESGRHSCLSHHICTGLSEVKAEMKRNPGMKFRIILPKFVGRDERDEFEKLNPVPF